MADQRVETDRDSFTAITKFLPVLATGVGGIIGDLTLELFVVSEGVVRIIGGWTLDWFVVSEGLNDCTLTRKITRTIIPIPMPINFLFT